MGYVEPQFNNWQIFKPGGSASLLLGNR